MRLRQDARPCPATVNSSYSLCLTITGTGVGSMSKVSRGRRYAAWLTPNRFVYFVLVTDCKLAGNLLSNKYCVAHFPSRIAVLRFHFFPVPQPPQRGQRRICENWDRIVSAGFASFAVAVASPWAAVSCSVVEWSSLLQSARLSMLLTGELLRGRLTGLLR